MQPVTKITHQSVGRALAPKHLQLSITEVIDKIEYSPEKGHFSTIISPRMTVWG